ncbi:unnamed protein product [Trichobilharzia regenti]|nr:unnamed protein product [Trichobilharzia regenti]
MEAVKKLSGKGLDVKFHQLDITEPESRKSFLEFVRKNYPDGINIAVNNAGIAYKVFQCMPYVNFQQNSTAPFGEQARVTINTNFTCTVNFIEETIPLLAENASLKKLSDELYHKFVGPMSISELKGLMNEFVK